MPGQQQVNAARGLVVVLNSALLVLVFGNHAAVTVRIGTRQSSAKLTFLPRFGTTGRATDGERLFGAAFFLDHGGENTIPISGAGNGQF